MVKSKAAFLCLMTAALSLLPACATESISTGEIPAIEEDESLLETECESQLTHLAALIDGFSAENENSKARLIEARELYSASEELYLRKEYKIALKLIEEAIQIIEEKDY